jgi:hypothetical protein
MKNKLNLLLLISGLLIAMVINSCKKDNSGSIKNLFTGGKWQLASITATNYIGNQEISTETLDSACMQTQFFTFNTDGTCSYTNFDCIAQTSTTAPYTLAQNQLFLNTNIVCKDTTTAGSSMPFANAAIVNLGQFSMVLQTGDIAPNYSLTQKRRILQYGFVRQTTPGQ